jgi:branched-chain amino acid transport system substrate-binding protein
MKKRFISDMFWSGFRLSMLLAVLLALPSLPLRAEALRIGVSGSTSGPNPQANAISAAVSFAIQDARNSGMLKQDVETVTRDDQCKPDLASNIARQFAEMDRVNLVIGHSCAGPSLAASRVYQEKGILQIDPITTLPVLTEQTRGKRAALFRIAERQDRAAAVAVFVLRDQIASKNVCLVGDALNKNWTDHFQSSAAGAPKQTTISDKIPDESSGADLCVVYDPYNQYGLGNLSKQDKVYAVFGPDERFPSQSANVAAITDFAKRMKAAGHSVPLGPAINSYAAVQIWIKAMNEAHSTETEKITEQMRKLRFETIRGLVAFDEIGDVKQPLITIVRYSNPIIQVPNKCNEPACKDCACSECCPK